MPEVIIYTDGACLGNPGPGGWAAILKSNNHYKEISGGEKHTTNNRMELTAIIRALESLKRKCNVQVYTDSKYIHDAINKGWLEKWTRSNWLTVSKKPVKNKELWEKLLELLQKHEVKILWVKGHSGHRENERCDLIAKQEALKRK
ncbi:ribonuclease HI [Desulfothermus okinawensis JCM 13304]